MYNVQMMITTPKHKLFIISLKRRRLDLPDTLNWFEVKTRFGGSDPKTNLNHNWQIEQINSTCMPSTWSKITWLSLSLFQMSKSWSFSVLEYKPEKVVEMWTALLITKLELKIWLLTLTGAMIVVYSTGISIGTDHFIQAEEQSGVTEGARKDNEFWIIRIFEILHSKKLKNHKRFKSCPLMAFWQFWPRLMVQDH